MSEVTLEGASGHSEDVCRDFLRNVCNRGKKCRFKHPLQISNGSNSRVSAQEEKENFCKNLCHDFQNTVCNRDGCKFIHCSKDDQENFMETGSLPSYVLEDAIMKSLIPYLPGEAPVCRDYLNGECRRGKSCRFRHLSHCKYKKELDILFGVQSATSDSCHTTSMPEPKRMKSVCPPCNSHHVEKSCIPPSPCNFPQTYMPHEQCNGHVYGNERYSVSHHSYGQCAMGTVTYSADACCERVPEQHRTVSLQDENSILKKQLFDLRRQVSDLMTANEFLLEQNAELRMMRKNGGLVTLQPPTSATLNVQPAPGQQLVASAVPVSIAPVTGPGPGQMTLSTMPMTGQTSAQQLVPVSCHARGPQIMAAVNTVTMAGQTGSPTLLPVSVSSTASQLVPVSAVPVSLATVSMAPVHIPPIVTAASEPSQNIAMSVSAATSLVSYPIMTQPLLQTR